MPEVVTEELRPIGGSCRRVGTGTVLIPLGLYLLGALFWLRAFWYAELLSLDWRLTRVYQQILERALLGGQIPYVSDFHHYTDRYLGTPETPLSPQYLLLPWMDVWAFNLFNIIFLYSLSFLGLLCIRRRHQLTVLSFTLLFLLFSFNGSIVVRVGVGHSMWFGYFLLPFVYLFLFDILERRRVRPAEYGLAGALFLMALQGSFHLLVWTAMLIGLVALFSGRHGLPLVRAGLWTLGLCAFRVVPSALSLHGHPLQFIHAYPTLGTFFDGLTAIRPPSWLEAELGCGWADMNCYVGFAGLAYLVYFGWVCPLMQERVRGTGHWAVYPALVGMVALSMAPAYKFIFDSGLPLLSSQRIPARFNMVIISAWIVLATISMQKWMDTRSVSKGLWALLGFGLIAVAYSLNEHSAIWNVRDLELANWRDWAQPLEDFRVREVDMQDPGERKYVQALWASAAFSGFALFAWCLGLFRAMRSARD